MFWDFTFHNYLLSIRYATFLITNRYYFTHNSDPPYFLILLFFLFSQIHIQDAKFLVTLIRFEIRYRFQVVLSTPTHIFYESPEFIFSTRQSDFKHSYHHLSKFISITQKNPFQNDFFHSGKGFYPFVVILFLQVHKLLTSTETYQNLYICSTKCSTQQC